MALARLILLAACLAVVAARPMGAGEASSATRSLLQTPFCPQGCATGMCQQDATKGGLRCSMCQNGLVVDQVTGQCACPPGRYSSGSGASATCEDCPKGSWCAGGIYNPGGQNTGVAGDTTVPVSVTCPANMTTLGKRSTSNRACVQLPGFYYTIDNNVPGAVECPINTYGPGLKKQRACVPCPTGFTTNLRRQQIVPTSCIVPAGYYLKAPGQVAPCPRGEWKAGVGISANCTKCAWGVTTPNEASTFENECSLLVAGYFAVEMSGEIIKRAQICPQGYYCPGGNPTGAWPTLDATIVKCPQNTLTVELGAIAAEQCLVPPGYQIQGGTLQACPAGSFRADWKPAASAGSCTSCGEDVKTAKTNHVTTYPNPLDPSSVTFVSITASSSDCYIMPGQGLYFMTLTNTWRAKNCDSNSYGVANITYGLSPAACRDCPAGQVATLDSYYTNPRKFYIDNKDGTKGFISVLACVNKPGYGYDGRVSQPCAADSYNEGDNYGLCKPCGFGRTTVGIGNGTSDASCGVAPGYGTIDGVVRPCPKGAYNDVVDFTPNNCTQCSGFTTTSVDEGASSSGQCDMCIAGYGGSGGSDTACGIQCGGIGASATYGTAQRAAGTPCTTCSTQNTGFAFEWMSNQDLFQAQAISEAGADAPGDCLSQFSQTVDGAWYIAMVASPTAQDGQGNYVNRNDMTNTFADCVSSCGDPCMFVTYDYKTKNCFRHLGKPPVYMGAPVVAIKAVPSGDVAASSKTVEAKSGAVTSGKYTYYEDEYAADILDAGKFDGWQTHTSYQSCLSACDNDAKCVGVKYDAYVYNQELNRWKNCRKIVGVETVGVFLRSMTRADVSSPLRVKFPFAPGAYDSPFSLAVRTNTLGAGFAGSGFLIFYFTGVTAILKHLGIINKTTRLAGASSGAINAVQACSDTSPQQAFDSNLALIYTCKPQRNCQGFLDRALNATLSAMMVPDAGRLCAGRLWVSITVAKPDNQPDVNLLETQWSTRQELASTLRLSSFLPGYSAPSATLRLDDRAAIGACYDGGFSQYLPCPPGVKACVKVSTNPFGAQGFSGDKELEVALKNFNQLASATPALMMDPNTGPYIPLNPVLTPTPPAEIYPGISGPLPVDAATWKSFSFGIPDVGTIREIYDVGRRDAAFWVKQQGLASAADVAGALQATQVKL